MKTMVLILLVFTMPMVFADDATNPYQGSTADPYAIHSQEIGKDKPVHAEEKGDVDFLQGS